MRAQTNGSIALKSRPQEIQIPPPHPTESGSTRCNMAAAVDPVFLARLVAGDPAAFEFLCKSYQRRLYQTAYQILRDEDDALDAVQETFFNAYKRIQSFRAEASIGTWLTRIAINCALMVRRKKLRSSAIPIESDWEEGSTLLNTLRDSAYDVELTMLKIEQRETLDRAILCLRPTLRGIVEAYRRSDLSLEELAALCGVSVAAAKSRLSRARRELRKAHLHGSVRRVSPQGTRRFSAASLAAEGEPSSRLLAGSGQKQNNLRPAGTASASSQR